MKADGTYYTLTKYVEGKSKELKTKEFPYIKD